MNTCMAKQSLYLLLCRGSLSRRLNKMVVGRWYPPVPVKTGICQFYTVKREWKGGGILVLQVQGRWKGGGQGVGRPTSFKAWLHFKPGYTIRLTSTQLS